MDEANSETVKAWYEGVNPEYLDDDIKNHKTLDDLLKTHINQRSLIGKKTELPKLDDEAGMARLFEHIGAKSKPEDFVFGEDIKADENTLKAIKETFASSKLTTKQAEAVLKKFVEIDSGKASAEEQAFEDFKTKQLEVRQGKYGEKLKDLDAVVNFAINKLSKGNEDFAKALNSLASDNNYFEMFREIGATLKGDNPAGPGDKQAWNKTGNSIDDEIANFLNPATEQGKAYLGLTRDEALTAKAQARMLELYKLKAS